MTFKWFYNGGNFYVFTGTWKLFVGFVARLFMKHEIFGERSDKTPRCVFLFCFRFTCLVKNWKVIYNDDGQNAWFHFWLRSLWRSSQRLSVRMESRITEPVLFFHLVTRYVENPLPLFVSADHASRVMRQK